MFSNIFDHSTYPRVSSPCDPGSISPNVPVNSHVDSGIHKASRSCWFAPEIDAYMELERDPIQSCNSQRETIPVASSLPKTGALHGTVPTCIGYDERKFALEYDRVLRNYLQGDPGRPRSLTEDESRRLSTVKLGYSESSATPAGHI
jgi:hypothetical protein